MDYCYTCRRTLNGALVCPGCGAFLADADPRAIRPGARFEGSYAGPGPYPAAADGGESVVGPTSLAPTLHRGRAARRRQLARWKKTRRRAGVATAVALFGGGVTVASMSASGGGKGATAAAATQDDVAPVTLTTNTGPGAVVVPTADRSGAHVAPATHTVRLPHARPTRTAVDGAGSVRIGGNAPGTQPGYTRTDDSAYSAPAPETTTTAPPADSGTATTPPPATTAPSTPPPTTTAPATPPRQQLCLLIVCLG